jgi:hypothetical protein
MRGAPHRGLAWLMRRMRSRISAATSGLPGRCRDFLVQYQARALRCQRTTVSGCTICRQGRQPDQQRDSRTHNHRSEPKKAKSATQTEFIVDATIIPRMIVTSALSNRMEFSEGTSRGGRQRRAIQCLHTLTLRGMLIKRHRRRGD